MSRHRLREVLPLFDATRAATLIDPDAIPRETTVNDPAQTLHRAGLGLAPEIVRAAELENLDLAVAATVIAKESGGRNVWGSDGVSTGGTYRKGAPVTRAEYEAYRAAMKAGRIGRQGVGPAQCTSAEYQDRADVLGGCWDPIANMRSGFRGLKWLIERYGLRDGARRYNGSGPAAERYAEDFTARHVVWLQRLGGSPAARPSADAAERPTLRLGDEGAEVARLQAWLNAMYPAYSRIDLAPRRYGPQTATVLKEFQRRTGVTGPDADGTIVGPRTWAALTAAGYR